MLFKDFLPGASVSLVLLVDALALSTVLANRSALSTNRSIGIVVGNLNLVREKELGFPSQKRVGFNLSLPCTYFTLLFGAMSGDSFDWVTGAGADLADLGADGEDPCSGDRYCSCELCRSKPPERYTTSSMRTMAMWLSDAVCQ